MYITTNSQKIIRNMLSSFTLLALTITPLTSFAASCGTVSDLEGAVTVPLCFINTLIPILVGVEIIFFIYGVIRYLMAASSDVERQTGRKFAMWGVIAIAVTVGVWGLIMFLRNTAGISKRTTSVRPLQFSEEVQNL